jgi:hypothetical protein
LNLVNKILFGILSHSFNHNFAFHLLIPIRVGIIFMNIKPRTIGLNIHEYNAYPYLNNNKVWPAAYYKIINFYRKQNSVNQYIIQSLSTGETKRVFRHQFCDAEILRSDRLRSTGNLVVNHLKLFICNTIYIEPCQKISFRYFKRQFQPQFRYPSLNSQFYHFLNSVGDWSPWPPRILKLSYLSY